MDFEQLFKIIPKLHNCWTVKDVSDWLNFIGLSSLQQKFEICAIDGSCISQLNEQDFQNELHIESKIIRKKLMKWVTQGMHEYDNFLKQNKQRLFFMSGCKIIGSNTQKFHGNLFTKKSLEMQQQLINQKMQIDIESNKRQSTHNGNEKKIQQNELIIRQCEVSQVTHFSLKQKGGVMGRQVTNEIIVYDDFVSRYHAQIIYEQGQYYIRDCGSSSGTFLKITSKKIIKNAMVIEMGGNQFKFEINQGIILMKIIQGPNIDKEFIISKKNKITIGRKLTNQVCFQDDQHLSNIHATIYQVGSIWYIEDMATTNGTWLRLSPEGVISGKFLLQDESQFKLSTNLTYECMRNHGNRKTHKQKNQKCSFCSIADRNCIYIPCKHNVSCQNCALQRKDIHCSICHSAVEEIIKIYPA